MFILTIYPSELQLKANTSDTEAAILDLHLSVSNDIVSTKIHTIKMTILILKFSISHFLAHHAMEFISLNSSDLLKHLAMLLAINC